MSKNLKIIEVSEDKPSHLKNSKITKEEVKAKIDRLWLLNPEHFDPNRNNIERERINRSWELIKNNESLSNKKCLDLGCGLGIITNKLLSEGALVTALDIASPPLNKLREFNNPNLSVIQGCIPYTNLESNIYDLVISTDVIAYLQKDQFRLYFSELADLVKPDGYVICSTPLDINSDDALERFSSLALTEFIIDNWTYSYHYFYIKIKDFFIAPKRFKKASLDPDYKRTQLNKRNWLSHHWFKINSSKVIVKFWVVVEWLIRPLTNYITQNQAFLLSLEKICRFICSERGISHAIFVGKRRPLMKQEPLKPDIERKGKKQVWE